MSISIAKMKGSSTSDAYFSMNTYFGHTFLDTHVFATEMHQTRATAILKRRKCTRLEPQPLLKDGQTRATATLNRQKCARLVPQPFWKDGSAPDMSHSHFEKTEMRQTRATAILKRRGCARIVPQTFRRDGNASQLSHRNFEQTGMRQTLSLSLIHI